MEAGQIDLSLRRLGAAPESLPERIANIRDRARVTQDRLYILSVILLAALVVLPLVAMMVWGTAAGALLGSVFGITAGRVFFTVLSQQREALYAEWLLLGIEQCQGDPERTHRLLKDAYERWFGPLVPPTTGAEPNADKPEPVPAA